jgi:hypothetical protein
VSGVQHLLFKIETLVTRCDPRQIAGLRVTSCASPRTVEILFASLGISGLKIGHVHSLASPFSGERSVLLKVDKGSQAGNLLIGNVKAWHALVWASIAHNCADLVSAHVLGDQLGARKVGSALSAASVAAMTKGAILPEKKAPALDQSRRV